MAGPRLPPPREIYTGDEMRRAPVRAGAQDAYQIPSLVSGKQVAPAQLRAELRAPLPPAPVMPPPMARTATSMADLSRTAPVAPAAAPAPVAAAPEAAPKPAAVYRPRRGSAPWRVIEHLQAHGGHLLYAQLFAGFDINPSSVKAIFTAALAAGVLARVEVGGKAALALPGYVPPAAVPAAESVAVEKTPAPRQMPLQGRPASSHTPNLDALALTLVDLGRTLEATALLMRQTAASLISSPPAAAGISSPHLLGAHP